MSEEIHSAFEQDYDKNPAKNWTDIAKEMKSTRRNSGDDTSIGGSWRRRIETLTSHLEKGTIWDFITWGFWMRTKQQKQEH